MVKPAQNTAPPAQNTQQAHGTSTARTHAATKRLRRSIKPNKIKINFHFSNLSTTKQKLVKPVAATVFQERTLIATAQSINCAVAVYKKKKLFLGYVVMNESMMYDYDDVTLSRVCC